MAKMIAAIDSKGLIGNKGELPWRLPADLQYFKAMTQGKPILMGRKTADSLPKALPNRLNCVLSSSKYEREKFISLDEEEVKQRLSFDHSFFIIGGASLYEKYLPYVDEVYLTQIRHQFEGDTYFPLELMCDLGFVLVSHEFHYPDDKNPYPYAFNVYRREEKFK